MSAKRTLGLGLVTLLVWASSVWAEPLVDLNFADLTLGQAAEMLSQMEGVTVTVDGALVGKKVGLAVEQLPLSVALQLMAEAGGMVLTTPQPGAFHLAPAGPASATTAVWTPLKRGEVIKDILTPRRLAPSRIAGYFGRPGLTMVNGHAVLQHPDEAMPELASAWVPDDPAAAAAAAKARARLGATLNAEQQARWSAPDRSGPDAGPFLRLPKGVRAVIGFDPVGKLIVVGQPDAVKLFDGLVAAFDAEPASFKVSSRLLRLAPADIQALGLNWTESKTWSQNGQARTATVAIDKLAGLLAKPAAGRLTNGPELTLSSTKSVVVSLSAVSVMGSPNESCPGLPEAMAADIESVLASLDVRLMAWPQADRSVALLVDPVMGVAAAGLKQAGQKAELSQTVPCVAMLHNVPAGQALLMREFVGAEAPERTCAMLGELPLVGSLFNPASSTDRGWEAVLVLVPEG